MHGSNLSSALSEFFFSYICFLTLDAPPNMHARLSKYAHRACASHT
jgi:hypothetical protein